MRKSILLLIIILFMSNVCFASVLEQDNAGIKCKKDDGTYVVNGWEWIDIDLDGLAECYYFNETGYLVINAITPDGNTVNGLGQWVLNGIVQKKDIRMAQVNTIIAPIQQNSGLGLTSDTPVQSSSYDARLILDEFRQKCSELSSKISIDAVKDMKLNDWDNDDISAALQGFDIDTEVCLLEYEMQVDRIMVEYDLPVARKNKMMDDANSFATTVRSSLKSKLNTYRFKYNEN